MKRIITIIIVATLCNYVNAQQKQVIEKDSVTFKFRGKQYESLHLRVANKWYAGKSTNKSDWTFIFPDSVYQQNDMMQFRVPSPYDSIYHTITFESVFEGDTTKSNSFGLPRKSVLEADFEETTFKAQVPFFQFKDHVNDHYIINNIPTEFGLYSFPGKVLIDSIISYKQRIDRYVDKVKQYPNSHYLMSELYIYRESLNSIEDVKRIYNCFSQEQKNRYFGKLLYKFLCEDYFTDTELLNPITGNKEFIVSDKSKPTLVIFSASWCAPCHKAIPIYKQAYSDLKDIMNFVYVTIDEPKFLEAWNKIVKQEEIPWRSLAALNDSDKIIKLYYVDGVPYSFLIMPDNSITRLELREESDMKKLYEKVKR